MTSAAGTNGTILDSQLLADIGAHAAALDCGDDSSRRSFAALGAAGVLGLGAPGNADGWLPQMASVIAEISRVCMSTAFSVWANRMVVEYLLTAGTPIRHCRGSPAPRQDRAGGHSNGRGLQGRGRLRNPRADGITG